MVHEDKHVDIEPFANYALIYLSNGIINSRSKSLRVCAPLRLILILAFYLKLY